MGSFDVAKKIMGMPDGLVKAYLCLYLTLNLDKVVSPSNFDEVPFEVLRHAVRLIKMQQSEPQGLVGDALFLLSGYVDGLGGLQEFQLRSWSPLRALGTPLGSSSLKAAAMRWAFHGITQAIFLASEAQKTFSGLSGRPVVASSS